MDGTLLASQWHKNDRERGAKVSNANILVNLINLTALANGPFSCFEYSSLLNRAVAALTQYLVFQVQHSINNCSNEC